MRDQLIKTCLSLTPQVVARRLSGDFVPIFMMHRAVDDSGEYNGSEIKRLEQYLEYIRKHRYQPISLQSLFSSLAHGEALPSRAVVFTVDDGFADQFEFIAPVFTRYDVPATCFVITDFLDGKLWPWDDQVKYVFSQTRSSRFSVCLTNEKVFDADISGEKSRERERHRLIQLLKAQDQASLYDWLEKLYSAAEVDVPTDVPLAFSPASWDQVRQFVRDGHDVAAHTRTHRILSRLSDAEAYDEIVGSYEILKNRVADCADTFAYPTGRASDFGQREMAIIKASPISGSVTTESDAARRGYQVEAVPRFSLPDNMTDFLQYLSFIEVLKNRLRKIGPKVR